MITLATIYDEYLRVHCHLFFFLHIMMNIIFNESKSEGSAWPDGRRRLPCRGWGSKIIYHIIHILRYLYPFSPVALLARVAQGNLSVARSGGPHRIVVAYFIILWSSSSAAKLPRLSRPTRHTLNHKHTYAHSPLSSCT